MKAYINYPEAHFGIHRNETCAQIQKHNKPNQRVIVTNNDNLAEVLSRFIRGDVKFGQAPINDLWLHISLASGQHEQAFVYIVQALLGRQYKPLASAPVVEHC